MGDRTWAAFHLTPNRDNPPTEEDVKGIIKAIAEFLSMNDGSPEVIVHTPDGIPNYELDKLKVITVQDDEWNYPDYEQIPEYIRKLAEEGKIWLYLEHDAGAEYQGAVYFKPPGKPVRELLRTEGGGYYDYVLLDDYKANPAQAIAKLEEQLREAITYFDAFYKQGSPWPLHVLFAFPPNQHVLLASRKYGAGEEVSITLHPRDLKLSIDHTQGPYTSEFEIDIEDLDPNDSLSKSTIVATTNYPADPADPVEVMEDTATLQDLLADDLGLEGEDFEAIATAIQSATRAYHEVRRLLKRGEEYAE